MKISKNVSLKTYTTFGVQAYADTVVEIEKEEELQAFFASEYAKGPYMFIGEGSNLLFVHDYKGTLVKMQTKGITKVADQGRQVIIVAKAGEVWDDMVRYTLAHGWYGLENLAIIPGKVGSSPVQNIGAYGCEVKDFIYEVHAYEIATGNMVTFGREECEFDYRNSAFKHKWKGQYVVTEVLYALSSVPNVNIQYEDVKKRLEHVSSVTPLHVYDAVAQIRREKLPDPAVTGNAGSFFKNPIIPVSKYNKLKEVYDLKMYPISNEVCKVPAAQLISLCGWKGKRVGEVGVHTQQALVLVNYGKGTGEDVLHMAMQIQADVKEKFDIDIQMEVNII